MDVEETLARLNDFGPYQKRVLWITMLCFGFGAWVITLPVLIASNPVVHCTAEGVSNTTVDCNALMVNNRYCNLDRRFWDFASDEDTRTLVIRFQMYCGLDFKIGTSNFRLFFAIFHSLRTRYDVFLRRILCRERHFRYFERSSRQVRSNSQV